MNYNKLPADPTALILGIVSLVLGFLGCCCYGIFAFIPVILSIIGLVMANKSLKEYYQNQEAFSIQSKNNVDIAKILNIISIIINAIIFLFVIVVFAIYGTLVGKEIFKEYEKRNSFDDIEYQSDTIEEELDTIYEYEEEKNYIIDTTQIK
ncbi:conserved hypothetical protein [Flavobacterium sp. 9AF]|uniref:CCC motif membrane protein n=1 Tax=Flavobacterium sp. 9AF TaxID=2653142 RepID=UPI0012EF8A81|nr:CCC motif membrane protein [Flavobacterium sp. 9AF]VXB28932.1 conserved hypothetical protein [Flavobacterium sp. 9AF]